MDPTSGPGPDTEPDPGAAAVSAAPSPGRAGAAGDRPPLARPREHVGPGGRRRAVPLDRGPPHGLVERLILGRRHLGVPVADARHSATPRPRPPARPADEEPVEDVRRRHVEEDLREVLAADQVDVVDAEVDGRHLVPRGTPGPFPLHHPGQASPQAVVGRQEGLSVGPGGVELGVVAAPGAQRGQALPQLGRQAVHHRWARAHRLVDAGQAEHAEAGAELGHHGAVARHGRILPRRPAPSAARRRAPSAAPGRPGYSVNKGVSWSSSGPTAASARRVQLGALVDVDGRPGAGDEGEHGVTPALLSQRLSQRDPLARRQLAPGRLGHQLAGQHPVEGVEVLGHEDARGSSRTTAQATTVPIVYRPTDQALPGATSDSDQNPGRGEPQRPPA